jgi:hypothetical protein
LLHRGYAEETEDTQRKMHSFVYPPFPPCIHRVTTLFEMIEKYDGRDKRGLRIPLNFQRCIQ